MRIMGSEDGLNDFFGEGLIKQSEDIGNTWTGITRNAYTEIRL